MRFTKLVLIALWAGLFVASCGVKEPEVVIEIEYFDSGADQSVFEKWVLDLIRESCGCRGRFEESGLMVPESKRAQIRKALQVWSGENTTGVSFHTGHPDMNPPFPPGWTAAPFRHDPERKGIIDQVSITGGEPIGIVKVQAIERGLSVDFDAATSAVMARFTEDNVGNQMAILLNGEIISMPVIREPFSKGCDISGDFSEEEVKVIVVGLQNPPPLNYKIRE